MHRVCANLADHNAGCPVRHIYGIRQGQTAGSRCNQYGSRCIPCAGNIKHFQRRSRTVNHCPFFSYQGHPLFTAGHYYIPNPVTFPCHLGNLQNGSIFIGNRLPGRLAHFLQVRSNKCTAFIFFPAGTFRIYQHWNAMRFRHSDHPLAECIGAYALGIIRYRNTVQPVFHQIQQPLFNLIRLFRIQVSYFFKVQPQHLLTGSQDAHLGNRRTAPGFHQTAKINFFFGKQAFQNSAVIIIPCDTAHKHVATQISKIGGYVCRPSQYRINLFYPVDRYRCFRGNTFDFPIKIPIHHHIADDGNAQALYLLS